MVSRKKTSRASLPAHMVKGNLIEDIIRELHQQPDILVESRVKLPSRSNPRRRREIDVLATAVILGRPMHLAFECKNYGDRIGVEKIDEFKGKLEDVDIPVQYGTFIASENGFTVHAKDRADSLGIRLLSLEGLTADRLAVQIHEAFQSLIFLDLGVKSITVTSQSTSGDPLDLLFLRDQDGNYTGGIIDLIWAQWRDGGISRQFGEHEVTLEIPDSWRWVIEGKTMPSTASAIVKVVGHVITIRGKAERWVLRDAVTGMVDRSRITASFDDERTSFPAKIVETEEELESELSQNALARIVTGRMPLPRIRYHMYWPPSVRVLLELKRRTDKLMLQGQWYPGVLEHVAFEELEGTDLSTVWEPIWPAHPAAQDAKWPWTNRASRRGRVPSTPRRQETRKRRR